MLFRRLTKFTQSLPVGGLVAYVVFLPYINKVLKPKFADGC